MYRIFINGNYVGTKTMTLDEIIKANNNGFIIKKVGA